MVLKYNSAAGMIPGGGYVHFSEGMLSTSTAVRPKLLTCSQASAAEQAKKSSDSPPISSALYTFIVSSSFLLAHPSLFGLIVVTFNAYDLSFPFFLYENCKCLFFIMCFNAYLCCHRVKPIHKSKCLFLSSLVTSGAG